MWMKIGEEYEYSTKRLQLHWMQEDREVTFNHGVKSNVNETSGVEDKSTTMMNKEVVNVDDSDVE